MPNGTDTHSKDAYDLVWGSLTVIRVIRNIVISFALSGLVTGLRAAQDKQAKKAPPVATSGAQLFKQNCSVCHGNDGKGNGAPAASSPFAGSPPDLTTLAQRHDGEFPEAYIADVLRNGVKMRDHDPAEMPVWGALFKSMSKSDETHVKLRITNLTNYLKSRCATATNRNQSSDKRECLLAHTTPPLHDAGDGVFPHNCKAVPTINGRA